MKLITLKLADHVVDIHDCGSIEFVDINIEDGKDYINIYPEHMEQIIGAYQRLAKAGRFVELKKDGYIYDECPNCQGGSKNLDGTKDCKFCNGTGTFDYSDGE